MTSHFTPPRRQLGSEDNLLAPKGECGSDSSDYIIGGITVAALGKAKQLIEENLAVAWRRLPVDVAA